MASGEGSREERRPTVQGCHPGVGRGAGRRSRLVFVEPARLPVTAEPGRGSREGGDDPPVPEAWLGRAVMLVFVSGASTEYAAGRLAEVNDRGIVLCRSKPTSATPRNPCSSRGAPSSSSPKRKKDKEGAS